MSKSNKYGYLTDVEQSFKNNKGVFSVNEINELVADNKWTQYGQLELIETKDISSASSAIFDDLKQDIYDVHFLTINNYVASNDNQILRARYFENGIEESGTVYDYSYITMGVTIGFGNDRDTDSTFFYGHYGTGNLTNEVGNAYHYFYNLGDSTKHSINTMHSSGISSYGQIVSQAGSSALPQASVVDQIKFFVSSGTFSATASLYGIRTY